MSVKLKVSSVNGSIELTQYLDVEAGKGMEPGDPAFSEKVIAHSLLKVGGTLALENLKLKEQIFPLKLKAANKSALADLIQEINLIITTPGAQVEWLDEGASIPTYFDLVTGQFDDEFDYRLGQNNWLKGKLRLFSQPLGYKSRTGARALQISGLATTVAAGTSPIIVFGASGVIDGDAPALLQAQIQGELSESFYMALAKLPTNEYLPFTPAPSTAKTPASYGKEAFAPGGTFAHYVSPSLAFTPIIAWSAPTESKFSYVGEQRILVPARTPTTCFPLVLEAFPMETGMPTEITEPIGRATIAAATSNGQSWQLYDLGVISVPSSILAAGENFGVNITLTYYAGASAGADIGGLILLPESSTIYVNTQSLKKIEAGEHNNFVAIDGISNSIRFGGNVGVPASGIAPKVERAPLRDVSAYARGPIPQVLPQASAPVFAMLVGTINGSMNKKTLLNINVLERCRYVF